MNSIIDSVVVVVMSNLKIFYFFVVFFVRKNDHIKNHRFAAIGLTVQIGRKYASSCHREQSVFMLWCVSTAFIEISKTESQVYFILILYSPFLWGSER